MKLESYPPGCPEILEAIDELEALIEAGVFHLAGRVFIDEAASARLVAKIKGRIPRDKGDSSSLFSLTEEIDQVTKDSTLRFRGKAWIDEEAFFIATSRLKKGLMEYIEENFPRAQVTTP